MDRLSPNTDEDAAAAARDDGGDFSGDADMCDDNGAWKTYSGDIGGLDDDLHPGSDSDVSVLNPQYGRLHTF